MSEPRTPRSDSLPGELRDRAEMSGEGLSGQGAGCACGSRPRRRGANVASCAWRGLGLGSEGRGEREGPRPRPMTVRHGPPAAANHRPATNHCPAAPPRPLRPLFALPWGRCGPDPATSGSHFPARGIVGAWLCTLVCPRMQYRAEAAGDGRAGPWCSPTPFLSRCRASGVHPVLTWGRKCCSWASLQFALRARGRWPAVVACVHHGLIQRRALPRPSLRLMELLSLIGTSVLSSVKWEQFQDWCQLFFCVLF